MDESMTLWKGLVATTMNFQFPLSVKNVSPLLAGIVNRFSAAAGHEMIFIFTLK